MLRGEIWWADLEPPSGTRPVVLLTRDRALRVRSSVTVAQVTRTIRRLPVEVFLDARDGMPQACVVNADTLVTIEKSLLRERICSLGPGKMAAVSRAVRFALGLE